MDDPPALVLTKSKDWCYEREFRIMGSLQGGPAKLGGNFVPLRSRSYRQTNGPCPKSLQARSHHLNDAPATRQLEVCDLLRNFARLNIRERTFPLRR
jgi:hypothetical protein